MAETRDLVSIVFSFRNEESVLPELIRRTEAVLGGLSIDFELIFVNDDSTDRSLDILRANSERNPRIKVLNMARRFGVSECTLAGMEYASGDAVIYMDSDLQDPPELLPELIAKWKGGADVVYTVRTKRRAEHPLKLMVTRLAYHVIDALSEISLPAESGDFRLISRRVCDQLLRLREHDPYIRGLVRWIGFRQEPVFYERHERGGGKGHFPLLRSLNPARAFVMAMTSFSTVPVFLVFLLGMAGVAIALPGMVVAGAALAGGADSGTAFLGFLGGLLWSTLMSAIGIVGIYVVRVFKEVRGRPRYIVADTIGLTRRP